MHQPLRRNRHGGIKNRFGGGGRLSRIDLEALQSLPDMGLLYRVSRSSVRESGG
jgi:hypothetical protein